jgi:hypothetical protein
MKNITFILCLIICLFSCKKKKEIPAPQTQTTPPKYDATKLVGVWQSINQKTYIQNTDGSLSNQQTIILDDSTKTDHLSSAEFTASKVMNFYTFWHTGYSADSVQGLSNYATYEFAHNNDSIKYHLNANVCLCDSLLYAYEIINLTDTDFGVRSKSNQQVTETYYKKISGHALSNFIVKP